MPVNKNALSRYIIIDKCIRDKVNGYPSRKLLQEKISQKIDAYISDSSVDKDIKALKDNHNAPILFDKNKNGYYYADKNYSFRNTISDEELWIMDFASAAMKVMGDDTMNKKFKGISMKMSSGTNEDDGNEDLNFNYIAVEGSSTKRGYHWLFDLYMNIMRNETIVIAYAPFGRERKSHIVSPYLLKQNKNRWYLIGHSHSISSTIVLALDRIEKIEKSREKYFYDKNFDRDDYLKFSFGVYHSNQFPPEKVRLLFSNRLGPYIESEPIHKTQTIISNNSDGLLIEIEIYCKGNVDFVGKVLSYGEDAMVITPEYLKEEIINRANWMIERYV